MGACLRGNSVLRFFTFWYLVASAWQKRQQQRARKGVGDRCTSCQHLP